MVEWCIQVARATALVVASQPLYQRTSKKCSPPAMHHAVRRYRSVVASQAAAPAAALTCSRKDSFGLPWYSAGFSLPPRQCT
jgi:hypothetical protein